MNRTRTRPIYMEYPNCLANYRAPFVIDTSVVINLNATGYADRILQAVPNEFHVAHEVLLEIEDGRRKKHPTADALAFLVRHGHVTVVRLGEAGRSNFLSLVDGPTTDTLDDGEAATIASALEHDGIALIDERKALRICAERFAHLPTGHTVDLLAHQKVRAALGHDRLGNAVFKALYHGRMRVPNLYVEWIVNLIGAHRAAMCSTLPGGVSHGALVHSEERYASS